MSKKAVVFSSSLLVFAYLLAPALAMTPDVVQGGSRHSPPAVQLVTLPPPGPMDSLIHEVGDRIFFAAQEARLTPEAMSTLGKLVVFLENNPREDLVLEGHAHDFQAAERDLGISMTRARQAWDYLVGQGVAPARLKLMAFGRARPAFLGQMEVARAKNRRVQFFIEVE